MTSLYCEWPDLLTVFLNTPQIELNNKELAQLLLDTGSIMHIKTYLFEIKIVYSFPHVTVAGNRR